MNRGRVLLGAAAVLALALGLAAGAGARGEAPRGRWAVLGPLASAAASAQWVRVDLAFAAGEDGRGFDLAETAIALDPGATVGWELLVDHQIRTLGGELYEADPQRRRAWIESGLATAERGLASARAPEALALDAAIGLLVQLESQRLPAWPGGRAGLEAEALAWLERAHELGSPWARDLAAHLRERGRERGPAAAPGGAGPR